MKNTIVALLIAGAACFATSGALAETLAECRAANVKLDAEIDAIYTKAARERKISPAEAARYKQLEAGIIARRAALKSDGFTLADCSTMNKLYQAEKVEVMTMVQGAESRASTQAVLAECRAANVKLDGEIDGIYKKAFSEGKISPTEAARYKQLEAGIIARRAALKKDGFTLADCSAMNKLYQAEKVEVMTMVQGAEARASAQTSLAECRAANVKLDADIDAIYTKAARERKISPAEAARYKQLEAGIIARRAALKKDGFTLADCSAMNKLYQAEKVEVMTMVQGAEARASTQTVLAECRAANVKLDGEIDGIYKKAFSEGKITPAEAARYKQLEAGIIARRAALKSDGFTLADCSTMNKLYQAERIEVMTMSQ